MSTIINANIKFIRKQQGMTQQKFADYIGIKRSALGSYEEGRAQPSHETLLVIADKFDISTDKLLKEDLAEVAGQVVFGESKVKILQRSEKVNPKINTDPTAAPSRVLAITVDKDNNENIELVPEKAAASYLQGYQDPSYLRELPKFRLPFLPVGTYRAFEIKGDSMLPLPTGSIVIGQYVENWTDLKNGQPYIIVSHSEGIVYKRIENTIDDNGTIICRSDNPAYPPFRLKASDIKEAWQARSFILKEMPQNDVTLEKVMSSVINLQQEVMNLKDKIVH
ncbi:MAG: helix-turn-helix domain-containing protein [Chitinophagales bacterium]|jgi:transcriptional regulator with XRE-family HTH domain|nr:helix-turn-helix domain-containing protein [Chitinophagales bacterium]